MDLLKEFLYPFAFLIAGFLVSDAYGKERKLPTWDDEKAKSLGMPLVPVGTVIICPGFFHETQKPTLIQSGLSALFWRIISMGSITYFKMSTANKIATTAIIPAPHNV